ncbi:hypothetical protein [Pedobacter panaciterrae]
MEICAGEILERAVRRQEISISEVSKRMNVSRRTLYNWFGQQTLDKSLLYAIGIIIRHDFAEEFGADFNTPNHLVTEKNEGNPGEFETSISAEVTRYWMLKYINLLEEYNQLIDKAQTL